MIAIGEPHCLQETYQLAMVELWELRNWPYLTRYKCSASNHHGAWGVMGTMATNTKLIQDCFDLARLDFPPLSPSKAHM